MRLWEVIRENFLPFREIFGPPTDPRVIAALVIKGFLSLLGGNISVVHLVLRIELDDGRRK